MRGNNLSIYIYRLHTMNDIQETSAAHRMIAAAMREFSDTDGVLECDFHAGVTALLMRSLEMHLQGTPVERLLQARDSL